MGNRNLSSRKVRDYFTDIREVKAHHFEQGSGVPLIVLHGWGGVWPRNDPSLKILARNFRVIAPDLPGYGKSQKLHTFHSIENYAAFLKDFLGALGISKTHLLGHSMGSLVVAVFAALYPERTEKLILAGTDHDYLSGSSLFLRIPLKLCTTATQTQLGRKVFLFAIQSKFVLKVLSFLIVLQLQVPKDQKPTPNEWANGFLDHSPHVMLENFIDIFSQSFGSYFPRIKVPVLLLYGSHVLVTSLQRQKEVVTLLPEANLVKLKGAGHIMMREKPKEFANAVRSFLSQ